MKLIEATTFAAKVREQDRDSMGIPKVLTGILSVIQQTQSSIRKQYALLSEMLDIISGS